MIERVLEHREAAIELRRQAVLFRAGHHSDQLEVELARRGIPFVKYGGLKFLEAAHVKDLLCILRWAENPRDAIAAFRVLQLLPGIGPAAARQALLHLGESRWDFAELVCFKAPAAATPEWPQFCALLSALRQASNAWSGQIARVRRWYQAHLERLYDNVVARSGDLDQLEQIAAIYATRAEFLSELTLDLPEATGAEAIPPHLDEDYLVLSTIHSAKGQEWDAVFLLNVIDGCIPSDMAVGTREQAEEERRLLYVAMTRARQHLDLIQPMRLFRTHQHRHGDGHVLPMRSRFIPDPILEYFDRRAYGQADRAFGPGAQLPTRIDVAVRMRRMWD